MLNSKLHKTCSIYCTSYTVSSCQCPKPRLQKILHGCVRNMCTTGRTRSGILPPPPGPLARATFKFQNLRETPTVALTQVLFACTVRGDKR